MLVTDFNWRSGRVSFWDMSRLDVSQPLIDQLAELKEDLAQVEFANGIALDVGWYG